MSKLSLSRNRGATRGSLTSTQAHTESTTETLSREDILFQRQLEAALKKSQAEFNKHLAVSDDKTSREPNVGSLSPIPKVQDPSKNIGVIVVSSDESSQGGKDDTEDGEACDRPSPIKKLINVESDQDEPREPPKSALTPVLSSKLDTGLKPSNAETSSAQTKPGKPPQPAKAETTPKDPVPSTSGLKRPRKKPAKYKSSDSEESEASETDFDSGDGSDEEFYSASSKKKRLREPHKKPVDPPIKKSRVEPQKATNLRANDGSKKQGQIPDNPSTANKKENTIPEKSLKPQMSAVSNLAASKPAKLPTVKSEPAKLPVTKSEPVKLPVTKSEPAKLPVSKSEPVKTPASSPAARQNRVLIPKWTPPTFARKNNGNDVSPQTPSSAIGMRVGLSRNFKPSKPLHASFKSPE